MLSTIARRLGQDTAYSYALKRGVGAYSLKRGGGCGRACSPHTGPVRVLCGGYGITPDVLIFEGRIARQGTVAAALRHLWGESPASGLCPTGHRVVLPAIRCGRPSTGMRDTPHGAEG